MGSTLNNYLGGLQIMKRKILNDNIRGVQVHLQTNFVDKDFATSSWLFADLRRIMKCAAFVSREKFRQMRMC